VGGRGPAVAVLSGGNVDPLLLTKLIDHGLSAAGRYLVLRIVLGDHPGALAELTAAVAALGLNVLDVEHHRAGASVGVDEVGVLLTVETRDPGHRSEVANRRRMKRRIFTKTKTTIARKITKRASRIAPTMARPVPVGAASARSMGIQDLRERKASSTGNSR
jgi:hypothetical protein